MTLPAGRFMSSGTAGSSGSPVIERFALPNVVTTPVEADRALSAAPPAASRARSVSSVAILPTALATSRCHLLAPVTGPGLCGAGRRADVPCFRCQLIRRGGDYRARRPIGRHQQPQDSDPDDNERHRGLADVPPEIAQ